MNKFSTNEVFLTEALPPSKRFAAIEKCDNRFVQRQVNMEQKILSEFFPFIFTVCGLVLLKEKNNFLRTSSSRFSTKHLGTRCSFRTFKCAFNVSLRYKISNQIIPKQFHHIYNINFLPWSSDVEFSGDLSISIHSHFH